MIKTPDNCVFSKADLWAITFATFLQRCWIQNLRSFYHLVQGLHLHFFVVVFQPKYWRTFYHLVSTWLKLAIFCSSALQCCSQSWRTFYQRCKVPRRILVQPFNDLGLNIEEKLWISFSLKLSFNPFFLCSYQIQYLP